MTKYKIVILTAFFGMISGVVLAQTTYVRKQLEPDFFIPEDVKSKPEKLPPVYVVRKQNNVDNMIDAEVVPEYKQKYDQYAKEIESVRKNGKIVENKKLEEDLQKMSSDERFKVEKKPYQKSYVQEEFDKVLEKSLQ